MSTVSQLLTPNVKAEMNMLYTEPPLMTRTGPDLGFFCREHTYFLCRLNGITVNIRIGHYFILTPDGRLGFLSPNTFARLWRTINKAAAGSVRPTALLRHPLQNLQYHIYGNTLT